MSAILGDDYPEAGIKSMEIQEFVKREVGEDRSGHGYLHAERVARLAAKIQEKEGGDPRLIQAAALLHDCADSKLFPGQEKEQLKKIQGVLGDNGYSAAEIDKILDIISHLSWHLQKEDEKPFPYSEGNIVRDADRLEALGAIGIIRAISYGVKEGRPFYDEEDLKRITLGIEVKDNPTTLSHFYDKLLRLQEHFATPTGKALAQERTAFLKSFLQEFYQEILPSKS